MDMTQTDLPGAAAIDSYIGRVDAAARGLPPDRRLSCSTSCVSIWRPSRWPRAPRSHPSSRPSTGSATRPRSSPARRRAPTARRRRRQPPRSPWGPLEIMAVLLLIVGAFVIPIVGPLAGLVCAWLSPAWTRGEKWVATLLGSGAIVIAGGLVVSLLGAF